MVDRAGPPEGLLDLIGMDQEKMTGLAMSVASTMLDKMEPVLVNWVQTNAPRMVQSLLDKMEPALFAGLQTTVDSLEATLFQWLTDNAGPAVQDLVDNLKTSLPSQ